MRMKKLMTACLAGAVSCAFMFGATGCSGADVNAKTYGDPAATVSVNAVADGKDISDDIFGIFLEDINYASYAMDDNIVANGNFESLGEPNTNRFKDFWSATQGSTFAVEDTDGLFASHADYHNTALKTNVDPHYAKVTAAANGGLINTGYTMVPMAAKKGEKFTFSAFVKSPDGASKLTVNLKSGETIIATTTLDLPQGAQWIKYSRELTAAEAFSSNGRLELLFEKAGTYYVDAVALETQNATLGIKNYIYDAIAELSPKFMRFPGGCIIEGDNCNVDENGECVEVYDWKNSVGAVQNGTEAGDDTIPAFTYQLNTGGTSTEQVTTYGEWATRTNNYDLWGYNMDYGLGFYEYFLLCEKIGAKPVPIVNCGLSDQGGAAEADHRGSAMVGRHGKKVPDYIQDALDLIEFAKGDTNTKWGKIRSDLGHPEPFDLEYIGVGNEQFGGTYFSYYQQFLDALHDLQTPGSIYEGVQPIVGNGMVFSDCEFGPNSANVANTAAKAYKSGGHISAISDYGVVDHHYYMGYLDFFNYATNEACIYDKYSRDASTGYKVFVGEFSANGATRYYAPNVAQLGADNNTWKTALSEAAYMTALERNGDVVSLAAYAPMFGSAEANVNQWAVDMMYYSNTKLARSTNYYVQQLFMKNSGTHYLGADVEYSDDFAYTSNQYGAPVDILYQSVTYDEATGDIIVKIVNAGKEELEINIELADSVKGVADVTVLESKLGIDGVNTVRDGEDVTPKSYTLGVKKTFGYPAPANSVTAIRLHTK